MVGQLRPDPIDEDLWRRRDVEIVDMPLDEYISRLAATLAPS